MSKFSDRGYVVRETGPVYNTEDMDRTVKWFGHTLGWYSEIDERDSDGKGLYGCVYDTPPEYENLHLAPFTGLHMFSGKPHTQMIAFIKVSGIEKLHELVIRSGWEQISTVAQEPWGGKTCTVTTIDGYQIRFFE